MEYCKLKAEIWLVLLASYLDRQINCRYGDSVYLLVHWYPCLPKPHKNSLQNTQNVGCRKNFATNLCPLMLCVLQYNNGNNDSNWNSDTNTNTYFWYLTAPRRFFRLLIRVFVSLSNAELLSPRSDMLLRYFIADDIEASLLTS